MSVSTDEILELAKDLAEGDDVSEAYIRASISRAYYAAYLKSNLLDELVCDPPVDSEGKGAHARRISKFANIPKQHNLSKLTRSQATKIHSIAYSLKDLKAKRHLADYHIEEDCGKGVAVQSIAMVKTLLNRLEELYRDIEAAA